ncbi:Tetratricopeptide-like helical [Corchorus olitorius]|uniref:Signal recognition particle subunit SRP72 n=1 Tax=Corchorus olitorius TaxID=93759 RepID=A0A1R3IFU0_9ROSI|nr:Tetratricopeptide-like helical [Corchorus olitorius]
MAPKAKDKPKAAPSPSQPPPSIEDLFTSLNKHIQRSEFTLAVKVANQVLSVEPRDEEAIRCKVVALMKDDKIEEALSAIQAAPKVSFDFSVYKVLYRLGKMDACVDIYRNLQRAKVDLSEINLVAGLVSAGRASEVQGTLDSLRVKATSSFELAYNVACSLIEGNKHKDAEQLLLAARRIGQETLTEENYADDDIEIELAPISVQLAYVQQLLGHSQEALGAYTDIVNRNLADELSLAVAVNNLIAVKGPKDISDSLRKLDRLKEKDSQKFQLEQSIDLKLSPKQKETIYATRAREIVAILPELFPDSVLPVLLQAAVLVRENKAGKAEELLGQFAEKFPEKSKVIFLARAQVAAAAGHHQIAAESLSKVPDIQHMPATVATLVALKERAGDINGAADVLDSAIKWWKTAMTEDDHLSVIMQEAASFKLRHGKEEEAAHLYEELVKSHGSIEALVGLITTVAHVNVDKAEAYEKQLKPLPGLKGVDVDGLEKTSGAKHIEGPPPDPERWLPKRERSSYRPKRKDKRAAQVRGSQGAVVREKSEASASATSSNTSNAKPNQATSSKNAEQSRPQSKSSRKKSRN